MRFTVSPRTLSCLLLIASACAANVAAQQSPTPPAAPVAEVARRPQVVRALEYIKRIEPETVEEQIKITEIPAPPFKEEKRAAYFKTRFEELGLKNVRLDGVGNVIGERPGSGQSPTLVLAAHLDTVFPEETDVKAKREGALIRSPGISDDGRGLTTILAVARALGEAKIETRGTIVFVANVGEEGLGDLRGARHLFEKEMRGRITHFISIDGAGLGVTSGAVGSKRYLVSVKGPGGHSYGAFGQPNPIHALGRIIEKISRFQVPAQPKTTFNVGRIDGGTSVNSIAHTARFELDMRSESAQELAKIDAEFKRVAQSSLDEENSRWPQARQKLTLDIKQVGDRPTGEQSPDAPIVRVALEANKALGVESTRLGASSTDSNVPISLGIPAITIGGGGTGRDAHSLNESFDPARSEVGTQRALLIVLGIVGLK